MRDSSNAPRVARCDPMRLAFSGCRRYYAARGDKGPQREAPISMEVISFWSRRITSPPATLIRSRIDCAADSDRSRLPGVPRQRPAPRH